MIDTEGDTKSNNQDHIDTLEKGDMFGEIGLLTKLRRTATVVSLDNCMMFEIDELGIKNI